MIDDTMSLAWVGIALGRPTSKVQSRLPFLSLIQSAQILSSFMHVDEKCLSLQEREGWRSFAGPWPREITILAHHLTRLSLSEVSGQQSHRSST
jgi:hypothetical protein